MSAGDKQLRHLERAFAKLDPQTRRVFLMHRNEGLSYGEIAERLGITPATVERHISDALYHLATELERKERRWWRFW